MIQIQQGENGVVTSIKVDGIELADHASEFSLTQRAGEIAELTVKIPVAQGLEVELPHGVTIIEREVEPYNSSLASSRGAGASASERVDKLPIKK